MISIFNLKPKVKRENREQSFYLFLLSAGFSSTLLFGLYYYHIDVREITLVCAVSFFLFILFGLLSYTSIDLLFLFRLSILTAFFAFSGQIFYTGGVHSPSFSTLIIVPILGFFYRPKTDRYFYMGLALITMIATWILTTNGIASNRVPEEYASLNSFISTVYVFLVMMIYTFLFRYALVQKNRQLLLSMERLKTNTNHLIQTEKMASVGTLSAGIAHEINNPLNFIVGGITLIEKELTTEQGIAIEELPETTREGIELAKSGVERATKIVKSLNEFTRLNSEEKRSFDVHQLIENCLLMLSHQLKYRININKDLAQDSFLIHGNEGQIHQAIFNILVNANEAIEEDGTIDIKSEVSNKELMISIQDNGIGIEPNDLKRINDPFFTTKDPGQGVGLGLSIASQIVRSHGGKILFDSVPGLGTTVKLHLPMR